MEIAKHHSSSGNIPGFDICRAIGSSGRCHGPKGEGAAPPATVDPGGTHQVAPIRCSADGSNAMAVVVPSAGTGWPAGTRAAISVPPASITTRVPEPR